MRVVHVINDLRIGGAERLLTDIAPRLRAVGIDLSVVALAACGSFLEEQLTASGVPVTLGRLPIRSPLQPIWLARQLRGAQIVHSHLFPAQWWTACAVGRRAPDSGAPVLVTTEHNTLNRRRRPWLRPLDRRIYARYDAIAAISEATATALAAWVPEIEARLTVVENGVDLARIAAAEPLDRAELDIPAGAPLLVSVGRLEPQKDFPTLLRAMTWVPGAFLALAGDGPLRGELERLSATLGIVDRVRFLGRTPRVPALLKAADIYVQSSAWEGFGIAVVEALAAGRPVVVSDVPGVREIVGDTGLRFPAGDSAALASAVGVLMGDGARRAALGAAGPSRAAHYDIARCVESHHALYRQRSGA